MKKILTLILITLCLFVSGCGKKEEVFIPETLTLHGTVKHLNVDTKTNFTLTDEFGEEYQISAKLETLTGIDLFDDCEVTVEVNTVENEDWFDVVTLSVDYTPLRYILGYTGEELLMNVNNHNSQTIHIKESFNATATVKGRSVPLVYSHMNTLSNDVYTRHGIHTYKTDLNDVTANDMYEYYITNTDVTTKYFNNNYTGWYFEEVDCSDVRPDLTISSDCVEITNYELNGTDVIVEGTLSDIKYNTFLGNYVKETLTKFNNPSSRVSCVVKAVYDSNTKDLKTMQYTVTVPEKCFMVDIPFTIENYIITVYGVEYDNIEEIIVPDTITTNAINSFYIDNPLEDKLSFDENQVLCLSLFNISNLTAADIKSIEGFTDEITMFRYGIECMPLCEEIKYYVNNYTTVDFMNEYVNFTGDEDYKKSVAANVIYTWLQKYNIKIDNYKSNTMN